MTKYLILFLSTFFLWSDCHSKEWDNLSSNPLISDASQHRRDPSSVIEVNGTYYVYYNVLPLGASDTFDTYGATIGCASAPSIFGPWTEQSTTTLSPTVSEWDENGLVAPDIIYQNSTFYLFYNGLLTPTDKTKAIGVATSSSPCSGFTKSGNNPILEGSVGAWDEYLVGSQFLLKMSDGSWRMYYKGRSSITSDRLIGIATISGASFPDGSWVKYDTDGGPVFGKTINGSPDVQIDDVAVMFENGKYYIMFMEAQLQSSAIWYESPNGIDTWTDTTRFDDIPSSSLTGTWAETECMGYATSFSPSNRANYMNTGGRSGAAYDSIGFFKLKPYVALGGTASVTAGGSGSVTIY